MLIVPQESRLASCAVETEAGVARRVVRRAQEDPCGSLFEQVSSRRVSTDQSEVFFFFLKRLTVSFACSTSDKHLSSLFEPFICVLSKLFSQGLATKKQKHIFMSWLLRQDNHYQRGNILTPLQPYL